MREIWDIYKAEMSYWYDLGYTQEDLRQYREDLLRTLDPTGYQQLREDIVSFKFNILVANGFGKVK